ncbi:MAG: hypothetical protein H6740_21765 [Alphaproteobacteria bacterium]|nr:hypothetical protein [Alphaproteobacteria bacterium]
MRRSTLLAALGTLGLVACIPEYGQNGPEMAQPPSGEGPCFEANITDGLQDGDELLLVFDCFNAHGAFDPLAPTVRYLATSENVTDLLEVADFGLSSEVDLQAGLDSATGLLQAEEDPLGQLLELYVEIYDRQLIGRALNISLAGATQLVACEASADPASCSLPRLVRRALDTDIPDRIDALLTYTEQAVDDDLARRQTEATLRFAHGASIAAGQESNVLLDVARFFFDDSDGAAPIDSVLPWARYALSIDENGDDLPDVVSNAAYYLAEVDRRGDLSPLPSRLYDIYTLDSEGNRVGFEGDSMLDELIAASEGMEEDAAQLVTPITIGGEEVLPLELVLNLVRDFYEQGLGESPSRRAADVAEMISLVDDNIDTVCGAFGRSSSFCRQLQNIQGPAEALIETEVVFTGLPVIYGVLQVIDLREMVLAVHGKQLEQLTADELLAVMDFGDQVSAATEPLTQVSLETQQLEMTLETVNVYIDLDAGRLTEAGQQAVHVAQWAIEPLQDGGPEVIPALVPRDVLLGILDSPAAAQIDWFMGNITTLMLGEAEPESGLTLDNIEALQATLEEHVVPQEELDLVAEVRDILDNEPLWMAGLRLGADAELMTLLTPGSGREGAPWYLYDLIERGVLDRVLAFASTVLDTLQADDEEAED